MLSNDSKTTSKARWPGLSSVEVEARRRKYGANVLTPPERDPWWKLYLEKYNDPVIRILMIAAGIAIGVGVFHGAYIEGIGIIIAVLLATTLAFVNEFKANKEFDILNQVSDDVPIQVIRNSQFTAVPRRELVVGDIVLVEAGEEVPADGALIEAVALLVNESGLTGESEPNHKYSRDDSRRRSQTKTTYPADQVFRGSMVLDGHGTLEVTHVGDSTELGKTARAAAEETGEETPLNQQLEKLSKLIGVVGFAVAAATFAALVVRGVIVGELDLSAQQWAFASIAFVGMAIALSLVWLPMVYDGLEMTLGLEAPAWLGGDDDDARTTLRRWASMVGLGLLITALGIGAGYLLELIHPSPSQWLPVGAGERFLAYFMIAVTIIVVAVPEGLAMSVTLSLAYSMRKMTAANTLVRKMHACETIGAATVICSDKTGTLTMNEMRVFAARYPALGADPDANPDVVAKLDPESDVGALIVENIAANTTAHLSREGERLQPLGNPTEAALLLWLDEQHIDYVPHRDSFEITYQLTFSTERKWMATFGESDQGGRSQFHIKGAPELVLARCTKLLTPNGLEPLGDYRDEIQQELIEFQARGMRTLGLAYHDGLRYEEGMDIEMAANGLVWLGFLAIADPVRPEVPPAIEACRRAGIQVKMVTGDNPDTAQEIARQIGLWGPSDNSEEHLAGPIFQSLGDEQAEASAERLKILSRAKPLDKVRLVRSLQKQGEVVAVTGDGINDCGALNYADVGLAMGRTGKAAAKEASDIILLDDSFRTIVDAVMWGRSLYENIQRFILFQLTINVTALGIALLGPFIGVELPLTVIQMLWVNLIMDTFAALALATEPPHRGVLDRPPRRPRDFIVTKRMAINIFGVGAVFLVLLIGLLKYLENVDLQDPSAPEKVAAAVDTPPETDAKPVGTEASQPVEEVNSYELSIFFTVFVMLQLWNLFNARCLGMTKSAFSGVLQNKGFVIIAAAIFGGQILITQFGGEVFRTVPLDLGTLLLIIVATSPVLWIGETWRLLRRLRGEGAEEDGGDLPSGEPA